MGNAKRPPDSPLAIDEHEFDFASPSATSKRGISPQHKSISSSTTDDDSNDSILDWLDEPRAPSQQKRQSLLPTKSKTDKVPPRAPTVVAKEKESKVTMERSPDKEFVLVESGDDSSSFSVEQWMEAIGMTPEETEQREFRGLAERAHNSDLPSEWQRVNDNLYQNLHTNERRMSHPMMDSLRNELTTLRKQKIAQL